jgi:hypothetical protein
MIRLKDVAAARRRTALTHYSGAMTSASTPHHSRFRLLPMRPRDAHEPHRAASSLELFFDLVFVIAISTAAVQLHHSLTEDHVGGPHPLRGRVLRDLVGVDELHLVRDVVRHRRLALPGAHDPADERRSRPRGGDPAAAFEHNDFTIMVIGYVVMRLALLASAAAPAAQESCAARP